MFGDRLRLARRRRRLSAKQVAERAGMSPMTLRSLERGGSGVTMGAYLAVMQVLGIENDLDLLAKADPLGRALQDARLPAAGKKPPRIRPASSASAMRPKRSVPVNDAVVQLHHLIGNAPQEQLRKVFESLPVGQLRKAVAALPSRQPRASPAGGIKKPLKSTLTDNGGGQSWREQSGFADSETLASLIDPPAPLPKKRR